MIRIQSLALGLSLVLFLPACGSTERGQADTRDADAADGTDTTGDTTVDGADVTDAADATAARDTGDATDGADLEASPDTGGPDAADDTSVTSGVDTVDDQGDAADVGAETDTVAPTTHELWVDPASGDDGRDGTADEPLASLARALERAHDPALGATDPIHIHLAPGTYPLEPTIITRDHLTLEGTDDGAVIVPGPETEAAEGANCLNGECFNMNPLLLVRSDDVAFVRLAFQGPGVERNFYFSYMEAIAFEGQYKMAGAPRAITGARISGCAFDGLAQAASFNFASGVVEDSKVENAWIGFLVGPSPGGGKVTFQRDIIGWNHEVGILATGTPEGWTPDYWSAPGAAPASLDLVVTDCDFRGSELLGGIELAIRDFFPALDPTGLPNQSGHLSAVIQRNTLSANAVAAILIADLSQFVFDPSQVPLDCASPWPAEAPVTIDVSLADNTITTSGATEAEPWEHTARITFQQFGPYFESWLDCHVQNTTLRIDDPGHDLAAPDPDHRFEYRLGGSDNRFEYDGAALVCDDGQTCLHPAP